jgi:propionyl-CoA carboxylase alpha chain
MASPGIPFLAALMQHPRWRSGTLSTGLSPGDIGRFQGCSARGDIATVIASVAAAIDRDGRAQAAFRQMMGRLWRDPAARSGSTRRISARVEGTATAFR